MARLHRGKYEPRHNEAVTDKRRHGRVIDLHFGSTPDVVDVKWADGSTQRRVPSQTLSHDYESGES